MLFHCKFVRNNPEEQSWFKSIKNPLNDRTEEYSVYTRVIYKELKYTMSSVSLVGLTQSWDIQLSPLVGTLAFLAFKQKRGPFLTWLGRKLI